MTALFAKSILLVRTDRLGDCLAMTPVIRAVRACYSDARIDLLASNINVEAVQTNPHLDNVYVMQQRNPLSWPGLLRQLRGHRYDLALCLNGNSFKAALFTRFSGAGTRVGYAWEGTTYSSSFDQVFSANKSEHITRGCLNFLNKLDIPSAGEGMEFVLSEDARRRAAVRFPRSAGKRLAVFIGNANKTHSRWPADKFALLTQQLLAQHDNLEIALLCGKAELPLLSHFAPHERLGRVTENLVDTAAFLTTCDALLTSSSGPWHVAAAVGTPTLSIISGFNYEFWRPLEGKHAFVLKKEDKDVRTVEVEPVRNMVEDFLRSEEFQ